MQISAEELREVAAFAGFERLRLCVRQETFAAFWDEASRDTRVVLLDNRPRDPELSKDWADLDKYTRMGVQTALRRVLLLWTQVGIDLAAKTGDHNV